MRGIATEPERRWLCDAVNRHRFATAIPFAVFCEAAFAARRDRACEDMRRLKHSRSTLAKGISQLVALGLFAIGLGCFQIFFFPALWAAERWFVVVLLAIEALLGAVALYYPLANIRRNETFVCLLEDGIFQCVCPLPRFGQSFKIRVAEICRIEKEVESEESCRWYLVDAEGRRYWLTSHYHNPAEKFVEAIKEINPHVVHPEDEGEEAPG